MMIISFRLSSSSGEGVSTFCSLRFCTVEQVTLADNNGHLSARFCVMRRKRRRLLDLSTRVTVYNPLTASSYWRMAAVLTELRHDAVIGLPGTQKRVAVDAPPYQSHKFNRAWGLSWGLRRGAYESNRSAGVSLVQTRTFATGILPATPVERTMWCRGGKKTVPKPSGRGEEHLGGKRWMLCTNGLMVYSCLFQHVACRC